jgi:RNA polymerase sigma-70 factor (ECF subfamily)
MDQETVKLLISQSIHGDTASFRKLVEFHQSFAYAAAFRLLCNDYEAEEIVQEAFIRVWKHLKDFKIEMRFTTWLYKIVMNLCYDKIKSNKTHHNRIHYDLESSVILNRPSLENIEANLINHDLAQIISFFTAELTPRQKLVFTLTELEGFSVDEITVITGMSPDKIKSNLYCARQNIKNKLIRIEERKGSHAL